MGQTAHEKMSARLAGIERRLAALEQRATTTPDAGTAASAGSAGAEPDTFWALERLRALAPGSGAVLFTGLVSLPGGERYEWQQAFATEGILESEWSLDVPALAALAHPARLLILREVLHGTRSAAALQALEGIETSGQLYHHVRQLVAAGWLRTLGRAMYGVPPERVIPLLVIIACVQR
jgi:hypothetical protein